MKVGIPMIDSGLEMDAHGRGCFAPIFFFKEDEVHSHLALQQWRLSAGVDHGDVHKPEELTKKRLETWRYWLLAERTKEKWKDKS